MTTMLYFILLDTDYSPTEVVWAGTDEATRDDWLERLLRKGVPVVKDQGVILDSPQIPLRLIETAIAVRRS